MFLYEKIVLLKKLFFTEKNINEDVKNKKVVLIIKNIFVKSSL